MELRHLQTFQAVLQAGSFWRAAEALDIAQPTVTLHIHQLEDDLGVQLFARQGKGMRLTEAGRLLQGQAAQVLRHTAVLRQTMAGMAAGDVGHVRPGAIEPAVSLRLPPLLAAYRRPRPGVRLTFTAGGTCDISARVAAGDLDIGICSPPLAQLGLTFEPLFTEPLALLVPQSHPLVSKVHVLTSDLAESGLLLTQEGCAYRAVIEQGLLERGTNPYAGIDVSGLEALKRCVQCGMGLAIIPIATVDPPPAGTVLRQIDDLNPTLTVGLARRPGDLEPSRALAGLVADLRGGLKDRAA